jgi:hypothetical protein
LIVGKYDAGHNPVIRSPKKVDGVNLLNLHLHFPLLGDSFQAPGLFCASSWAALQIAWFGGWTPAQRSAACRDQTLTQQGEGQR